MSQGQQRAKKPQKTKELDVFLDGEKVGKCTLDLEVAVEFSTKIAHGFPAEMNMRIKRDGEGYIPENIVLKT